MPSVLSHSVMGAGRHVFDDSWQNKPDALSQSAVPHEQLVGLTTVPSMLLHFENLLHELIANSQNNPEDVSQSLVPQLQLFELITVPLVFIQFVASLHRLDADIQNRPLVAEEVHILLPH